MRRFRSITLTLLAAVSIVVLGLSQRQAIYDWERLRGYQPVAAIQTLAEDTTMTQQARHLFYVNHPALDNKAIFMGNCPSGGEKTIVLGCYLSNERGIFVLRVDDVRLQGVEQVTAAHEMLHAAYDRLSKHDRQHIDSLLQDYYKHSLHDQRLLETVAAYRQSEPNDVVNEMHSIFGTEVETLPAPLEQYYKRYFTDRHKVAAYTAHYEQAFTSRTTIVKAYDKQLAVLKAQIAADEASLNDKNAALGALRQRLDSYRNSGNIAAYNAAVVGYNAQVDTYNSLLAVTKSLIAHYNQIVQQRNAVAVEEDQLIQSISGSATALTK